MAYFKIQITNYIVLTKCCACVKQVLCMTYTHCLIFPPLIHTPQCAYSINNVAIADEIPVQQHIGELLSAHMCQAVMYTHIRLQINISKDRCVLGGIAKVDSKTALSRITISRTITVSPRI